MTKNVTYADIILPLPLDSLFTYSIPDEMTARVTPGVRVLVPFGRSKTYIGIVAKVHTVKPAFNAKDIKLVMDEAAVVTPAQLDLWRWMSDYYMAPLGDVLDAALPAGMKSSEHIEYTSLKIQN